MGKAYLGIGSNLGERLEFLRRARRLLAASTGITGLRSSPLYETEPLGGPADQGRYLNAVLEVDTHLSADELLTRCLEIEAANGRERREYHGPRTLDIDLLFFDDQCRISPRLTLPHPRLHERRFVLAPLCDLSPGLRHPRLACTVAELLAELTGNGVTQLEKDW